MIGQTVSHYRILEELGRGGMGVVYKADDTELGRQVAVKFLPEERSGEAQAAERFVREARAAAALNHRHICTVHDIGRHDRRRFIVMELLEGRTLREHIQGGPMGSERVAAIGLQIAEALEAAHARGIVHRDIKPSNVVVGADDQVKVLDFGLAKLLARSTTEETLSRDLTGTGQVAGTLPYMAPEQVRAEKVDGRTDVYALGCVLYEMATGLRPFREAVSARLADDILHRPPEPPRRVNPGLSSKLEEIVLKCLEKAPENRYQSARELAVDLRRFSAPAAFPTEPTQVPASRGALIGAGVAALVTLVAAAVAYQLDGLPGWLSDRAAVAPPRVRSLAVLPLANFSHDSEQEYFADGMTEALTTELSKIAALNVISRTSAMRYKGTDKALPEIARELNVDAVVEGSVLRAGQRLRVTAQLIHAASDQHLWAESYERQITDVLALQSELARAIAHQVKVELTPREQSRLARTRRVDPEAYDAYLKGRFFLNTFTPAGFEKGLSFLQQAVDKDPADPLAYAGLALGYSLIGHERYPDAFVRAKAAAHRALELGETLAETQLALGKIKLYSEWDIAGAGQDLRSALDLNPSLAEAHYDYSWYLTAVGRRDEAHAEMKRAIELDPLTPLFVAALGWEYWFDGRNDAAIAAARQSLELSPGFALGLTLEGYGYAAKRIYDQAIAAHEKAAAADRDFRWPLGRTYALAGRSELAKKLAAELAKEPTPMNAWGLAGIHAALGEKDQAFRWLEEAYKLRFSWMPWIGMDHSFAPLREDPRFHELVRRMKLAPLPAAS